MKKRASWIPKSKYISFDVFDTLIKRSVARPEDLFLLMEDHLTKVHPEIPAGFARKRRAAERQANEEAGCHVGIGKMYDKLRGEYGQCTDELMALEIQMELNGCQPNPQCAAWLDRWVAAGKTVVLISDMYLPSAVISEMLEKCGVRGYKKLYVSCECGARKRGGSLFRIVLDDLKIRPKDLLHIGDNKRADLFAPLAMGIKAVWLRNDQKSLCKIPKDIKPEDALIYRTLKACIRNCSQGMNEYEKQGCEIFGPLLYGFTQWLTDQLRADGINDIYFLARDGYMLMRAFEEFRLPDVKTHYLYCSRRSYQVPMMWMHPDFEDVTRPFRYNKTMTIRSLLSRLGLEPDEYQEKVRGFGLQMDKIYGKEAIYTSSEVKSFYDSIKDDVIENARREYEGLSAYIKSIPLSERIAVVDVGWYGTMQQALEELIGVEGLHVAVKGCYVGVATDASAVASGEIDAAGYLYDTSRGKDLEKNRRSSGVIFEALFLAPHGSVKRFTIDGDSVSPEFEAYEYRKDPSQIIDEPVVMGEHQTGAMAFVKYMRNAFPLNAIRVSPEVALSSFSRLVLHPTLSEAKFWGDIRHINYQVYYCARPSSIYRYVTHPKELIRDFRNSNWDVGFLKRLFRVTLPYDKIADLMKELYYKL